MQSRVQQWGNSLAVRIPKAFLEQAQLQKDELIEMSVEDGKLTIVPIAKKRKRTLDALLSQITPENLHEEVDWGRPVGKEVW